MAVWIPPVNLPDLGGQDFGRELYAMAAGPGEVLGQQRRDQQLNFENQRNYDLELQKLAKGIGTNQETWFGSPQWFQREDGTMGYGVQSSLGNFKEVPPPAGAQWAPPVTQLPTGTGYVPVFRAGGGRTGGPEIQTDPGGEARAKEYGQAVAKAQAALPVIEYQSQNLMTKIDAVINDPNLPYLTGPTGGRLPTWFGTTDPGGMEATQANITQLVQKSFLQAYDQLRGAGAITEREGQAATEAMTVLGTQQMSDEAYKAALTTFRREVEQMLKVARARASGQLPPIDPFTGVEMTPPNPGPDATSNVITDPGATLPNSGVTLPGTRSTVRQTGQ